MKCEQCNQPSDYVTSSNPVCVNCRNRNLRETSHSDQTEYWNVWTNYCIGPNEHDTVESKEAAIQWLKDRQDSLHLNSGESLYGESGMRITDDKISADLTSLNCRTSFGYAERDF